MWSGPDVFGWILRDSWGDIAGGKDLAALGQNFARTAPSPHLPSEIFAEACYRPDSPQWGPVLISRSDALRSGIRTVLCSHPARILCLWDPIVICDLTGVAAVLFPHSWG